MATFTYTGTDASGAKITETVDAADRFAVYELARKNNHTVASVEEKGGFSLGTFLNVEAINALISRVKQDEIVMFTRNLSAMLKAGLAISRAISVSERQTKNPKLKSVLTAINGELNQGKQFNEALGKHPRIFSRLYIAMVRAGEEGGTLAEALEVLSVQMERASNLQKKIKGAMIYPAIVIIVMAVIGVLMMIFVIPTLTATFKELNADLPLTTRLVIGISDFLAMHSILALGVLVAAIGGFIALLKSKPGARAFEWIMLRLPVIGNLVKEVNSARTARTLSSLLSSGVDVINAIKITNDVVQNSFYREVIADAAVRVEKGNPLSEVFIEKANLYPVLMGEMIAVGEETGKISQMLKEAAIFYENEVERKTKDLSTIIEPVLMVVIGAAVGFFALAMIAPIYSISESI